MSDINNDGPQNGNETEAGGTDSPSGEAAPAKPSFMDRVKVLFAAVLATTRTHMWWWIGGGGAVLVGAAVAVVLFGGFLGPSGATVCTVSLQKAKDYGVISPSATLASTSMSSTDVANRKQCRAQVGDEVFILVSDIKGKDTEDKKCRDYDKQDGCIKLYSVARDDGLTTYQVRDIPPDETDEAILAAEKKAAEAQGGGAAAPLPGLGGEDSGVIETESANDGGQPNPY